MYSVNVQQNKVKQVFQLDGFTIVHFSNDLYQVAFAPSSNLSTAKYGTSTSNTSSINVLNLTSTPIILEQALNVSGIIKLYLIQKLSSSSQTLLEY